MNVCRNAVAHFTALSHSRVLRQLASRLDAPRMTRALRVALCSLGCATAANMSGFIVFCALQRMEATPDLSLVVVQDVLENRHAGMSMNSLRWTVSAFV